jgi:hypothetical protein
MKDNVLDEIFKTVQSNDRMILWTYPVGKNSDRNDYCKRDDLWAISTDELRQIQARIEQQVLIGRRELDAVLHNHHWQFIRTFIGVGKPRVVQMPVFSPIGYDKKPKIKMWTDCRQEYALYHCVCGQKKEVGI